MHTLRDEIHRTTFGQSVYQGSTQGKIEGRVESLVYDKRFELRRGLFERGLRKQKEMIPDAVDCRNPAIPKKWARDMPGRIHTDAVYTKTVDPARTLVDQILAYGIILLLEVR